MADVPMIPMAILQGKMMINPTSRAGSQVLQIRIAGSARGQRRGHQESNSCLVQTEKVIASDQ